MEHTDVDCELIPTFATLALVAKFPKLGRSKTRLAKHPSIGDQVALEFAQAALLDLVCNLSGSEFETQVRAKLTEDEQAKFKDHKLRRVFLFAPVEDLQEFRNLIRAECGEDVLAKWEFREFKSNPNDTPTQMDGVKLTHKLSLGLSTGLTECHQATAAFSTLGSSAVCHPSVMPRSENYCPASHPISFIGMDTPQLPPTEIADALVHVLHTGGAYISPATDGGYVLLAVPSGANVSMFDDTVVKWSCSETLDTQLCALKDANLDVKVGNTFTDVDEYEDLQQLQRLVNQDESPTLQRLKLFFNNKAFGVPPGWFDTRCVWTGSVNSSSSNKLLTESNQSLSAFE